MMYVVTFYSYKGGVGRTLALVNVAFRLARLGKSVFLLDFDLEAPGLDEFVRADGDIAHEGLVEYVSLFSQGSGVPPLREFVSEVNLGEKLPGRVFFMSAGKKDSNYQKLLSKLDWKYFYQRHRGFLFVENLKASIQKEYKPDYVLIDSRTGLTDISGICTLQLPELVVLVFNLNNQNIAGISKIHHSIRFNALNKKIATLLVASPIADVPDQVGLRTQRFEVARRALGVDGIDVVLPFDPFVSLQEMVIKGSEPKTNLARAYDLLCEKILAANVSEVITMLNEVRKLREHGDAEVAELRFQELLTAHPKNAEAWFEYGRFLRLQRKYQQAIEAFSTAHELSQTWAQPLALLAMTYLAKQEREEAASYLAKYLSLEKNSEALGNIGQTFVNAGMLEAGIQIYERALELAGSGEWPAVLHLELGNIYMRMNKPEQAIPHYSVGVELSPAHLPNVYNLGYALKKTGNPAGDEYLRKAITLVEQQRSQNLPPSLVANQLQAVGQAYSGLGEIEKARKCFDRALRTARSLPVRTLVFSSVQYKLIPAMHFIAETQRLQKNLEALVN